VNCPSRFRIHIETLIHCLTKHTIFGKSLDLSHVRYHYLSKPIEPIVHLTRSLYRDPFLDQNLEPLVVDGLRTSTCISYQQSSPLIAGCYRSIHSSTDHHVAPIGSGNHRSRPLLVRSRRGRIPGSRRCICRSRRPCRWRFGRMRGPWP
jgi:hypothetical protein